MIGHWLFTRTVLCCVVSLLLAAPVLAQEPAASELPSELTDAEIDAFVARLDDDGVRRLLIAQLQGVVDEQAAVAQFASDSFRRRAGTGEQPKWAVISVSFFSSY